MTLEELELRVRAAFPEATIEAWEYGLPYMHVRIHDEPIKASFSIGVILGNLRVVPRPSFDHDPDQPRRDAIEHRILSVSAHQLIAARRRLDKADAQ